MLNETETETDDGAELDSIPAVEEEPWHWVVREHGASS
jgi:hypothetical protein